MSTKSRYKTYTKLVESNDKALDHLASLRDYAKSEKSQKQKNQVVKTFFEAMDSIRDMAKHYSKIDSSSDLELMLESISSVEEKALRTVESLQIALNIGYKCSGVMKKVEEDLYAKVENLTKNFQDTSSKKFSIENAETPHDLIRYFHQKSVDAMFDIKTLKKSRRGAFIRIPLQSGTIEVIDLEGKLKKEDMEDLDMKDLDIEKIHCKPLKAILELYTSNNFESSESFRAMIFNEKLASQIELGCHYSELEAQIGSKNMIKFFFRDTHFKEYENAKYRSKYVRTVLKKLGFEVESKGNKTKAEWAGKDEKKAYKTLQEVVRLALSTRDLDLSGSHIDEYPNKAVNAFFKGVTDIQSYLDKYDSKNKKDDPKIK